MVKKHWNELSERDRRLIIVAGAVDGVLKMVALVDLWRRPAGQVRGSKPVWAVALTVVNSAGILPIVYFTVGRTPDRS